MKNLILGTAQLGLKYGINNINGKPDKSDSYEILDYAYENGIHILDTAEDYGDSEEVIGGYIRKTGHTFHICTKLSSKFDINNNSIYERISEKVSMAIERLGVSELYLFYLHAFKHINNTDVLKALEQLKHNGIIRQIGISIYEPDELEYIMRYYSEVVDVVQLPYNMLDCSRWHENNLLTRAIDKGIKLYVRSIFLQGLVFKSTSDSFIKRLEAEKYINYIHNLASKKNTNIVNLAFEFVNSINEIDAIVMGCETIEQLKQNIIFRNTSSTSIEVDEVIKFCTLINKNIVDPRMW